VTILYRMFAKTVPEVTSVVARLREAETEDIPCLVAMNHAAYPELVEANVVWDDEQLASHLARFRQGQIVAEIDGAAAGAFSTFIVDRKRDALAPHTWYEMTDHGTFAGHDPLGETLYLADIYVHPSAWGKGVSTTLYAALRRLCVQLRLKRVVGGGRLWGYHEHASRMTPEAYVASVLRGQLRDRVLGSQVKAGFRVRGVLADYLKDPRSCNYATLLEWVNPEVV
jgi:GNAT superfamily N-acetyltransferase